MRAIFTSLFLAVFILSGYSQDNRIEYNGQQLFLSGANLAWVNFARDIGPGDTDFEQFGKLFKETHDYGANSIRLWLHTTGENTPEFDGDTVSGPGEGAIEDLKQILDSAYKYDVGLILCLWSFDMLRLSIGEPYLTQNRSLLENSDILDTYIDNALIPMVDSLKDHPGIIAWEVFNEAEGMIEGMTDGSWGDIGHVQRTDVQFMVNRIAGAIHRVDPDLKVTNGTHTLNSLSDKGNGVSHNFYSDSALFNVGGDADGYLDFYQVHHYDFNLNPFEHHYSYWELDKPLILGEFHPQCSSCGEFSNYETLIDSGYAGALGWMWLDEYGESIKEEVQHTFLTQTVIVDIDNNLGDAPFLSFSGPEYGEEFDTGSDISFYAEAEDTDGNIDTVIFYLENETAEDLVLTSFSESADGEYNYTWQSPDDGLYKVYVIVIDNEGYSKKSNPIAFTVGEPPQYRYEAEEASISGGVSVETDVDASGGEYVSITTDCSILWTTYGCPAEGTYDVIIGYGVPFGEKNNFFVINGDEDNMLDIQFLGIPEGWHRDTIQIDMNEGTNTIEMQDSWGWMTFDFIELPFPVPENITELRGTSELIKIAIYPNPASDVLYFTLLNEISDIHVLNVQGQLIRTYKSCSGNNSIDISDLEKGLYFITFQLSSGVKHNYKFIKK